VLRESNRSQAHRAIYLRSLRQRRTLLRRCVTPNRSLQTGLSRVGFANKEKCCSNFNTVQPPTRASEVLYIDNGQNELCHLSRDQSSSLWSESSIAIPHSDEMVTHQAYVATLTLSDDKGRAVPEGYPVTFSSEPQFITANERSYLFDSRPTEIKTNSRGRVTLVIVPDKSLRAPTVFFSLNKLNDSAPKYPIQPAQRVMCQLGRYKSAEDLQKATTCSGKPLFEVTVLGSRALRHAATIMANFPSMLGTVDKEAAESTLDGAASNKQDFTMALEGTDKVHQAIQRKSV
jgi:hypothetical protein